MVTQAARVADQTYEEVPMPIPTPRSGRRVLVAALLAATTVVGLGGAAGAATLAGTPSHATVTFGSNLVKPNVGFGCGLYPTSAGNYATHASQCIWIQLSSGYTNSTVGSDSIPPGSGTLTTASVRIGATTGPMRFVMVRGFYNVDNGNSSCCVVLLQSKTFTPARNAVTTEKVNFPIVSNNSIVDGDLEVFDVLGLLVMSASTPIPSSTRPAGRSTPNPPTTSCSERSTPASAQLFYDSLGYQLEIRGSFVKS